MGAGDYHFRMFGRASFPSFGGRGEFFQGSANSIQGPAIEFGALHSTPKASLLYRADVRLFNGTILTKVRLPGPWYARSGYYSGFKFPFREGQFVVVGYRDNRSDSPVILAVLPFLAAQKDRGNLGASRELPSAHQYDPEETSVGHESGHKTVWDKDELYVVNKDGDRVFTLDLTEKLLNVSLEKFHFESDSVEVEAEMGDLTITVGGVKLKLFAHTHPTLFGPTGPPIYGG